MNKIQYISISDRPVAVIVLEVLKLKFIHVIRKAKQWNLVLESVFFSSPDYYSCNEYLAAYLLLFKQYPMKVNDR